MAHKIKEIKNAKNQENVQEMIFSEEACVNVNVAAVILNLEVHALL